MIYQIQLVEGAKICTSSLVVSVAWSVSWRKYDNNRSCSKCYSIRNCSSSRKAHFVYEIFKIRCAYHICFACYELIIYLFPLFNPCRALADFLHTRIVSPFVLCTSRSISSFIGLPPFGRVVRPKIRSWIIASRLQAVRFILFSQNIRSLFRRFFEFRALPSLYAKSALGLLAFTRFCIPFRNFILKFLHSNNLAHMATSCPHKIRYIINIINT